MSVNELDVWAAQERHDEYRRAAVQRRTVRHRLQVGFRLNMADRMSGMQAWLQQQLARRHRTVRSSLGRKTPLAKA